MTVRCIIHPRSMERDRDSKVTRPCILFRPVPSTSSPISLPPIPPPIPQSPIGLHSLVTGNVTSTTLPPTPPPFHQAATPPPSPLAAPAPPPPPPRQRPRCRPRSRRRNWPFVGPAGLSPVVAAIGREGCVEVPACHRAPALPVQHARFGSFRLARPVPFRTVPYGPTRLGSVRLQYRCKSGGWGDTDTARGMFGGMGDVCMI